MNRASIPPVAVILVEVGSHRPHKVTYDAFGPFKILWVITNGTMRRNFLWITLRKTGIYVAFGGPNHMHTSYHTDGRFRWKADDHVVELTQGPPLPDIPKPVLIQSATTVVTDEALDRFDLAGFEDGPVDQVIYLDNRMLPEALFYQVWAVPPFKHGTVPLLTDCPAQIHITTHTIPWVEVIIYEQGPRIGNPDTA
jgi:hypothetical protein